MCLKSGPESLQSACVFYPYNIHFVRICRITTMHRTEELREERRDIVPCIKSSALKCTCLHPGVPSLDSDWIYPKVLGRCIWRAASASNFMSLYLFCAEVHSSCWCVAPFLQIFWVRSLISCTDPWLGLPMLYCLILPEPSVLKGLSLSLPGFSLPEVPIHMTLTQDTYLLSLCSFWIWPMVPFVSTFLTFQYLLSLMFEKEIHVAKQRTPKRGLNSGAPVWSKVI